MKTDIKKHWDWQRRSRIKAMENQRKRNLKKLKDGTLYPKMKNNGMKNDFDEKTRMLFLDEYVSCWECNRSDLGAELHHILGRVSASPLNAIPLCPPICHKAGDIHSREKRKKYLLMTLAHLKEIKYNFTSEDGQFMQKYIEYYEN